MAAVITTSEKTSVPAPIPPTEFGTRVIELRKLRGMTQKALAEKMGVSGRHLSFVERGLAKPSRKLVMRIASVFDVMLRTRNELLLSAGFAPAYRAQPFADKDIMPLFGVIDQVLAAHMPYPAYAQDSLCNIVRANNVAEKIIKIVSPNERKPNLGMLALAPGRARDSIRNWPTYAQAKLQRMRSQLIRVPDDDDLRGLYELALSYCEGIKLLPEDNNDLVISMEMTLNGQLISSYSTISTFRPPQDLGTAEIEIWLVYPADLSTEEFFKQLAASN